MKELGGNSTWVGRPGRKPAHLRCPTYCRHGENVPDMGSPTCGEGGSCTQIGEPRKRCPADQMVSRVQQPCHSRRVQVSYIWSLMRLAEMAGNKTPALQSSKSAIS